MKICHEDTRYSISLNKSFLYTRIHPVTCIVNLDTSNTTVKISKSVHKSWVDKVPEVIKILSEDIEIQVYINEESF